MLPEMLNIFKLLPKETFRSAASEVTGYNIPTAAAATAAAAAAAPPMAARPAAAPGVGVGVGVAVGALSFSIPPVMSRVSVLTFSEGTAVWMITLDVVEKPDALISNPIEAEHETDVVALILQSSSIVAITSAPPVAVVKAALMEYVEGPSVMVKDCLKGQLVAPDAQPMATVVASGLTPTILPTTPCRATCVGPAARMCICVDD